MTRGATISGIVGSVPTCRKIKVIIGTEAQQQLTYVKSISDNNPNTTLTSWGGSGSNPGGISYNPVGADAVVTLYDANDEVIATVKTTIS